MIQLYTKRTITFQCGKAFSCGIPWNYYCRKIQMQSVDNWIIQKYINPYFNLSPDLIKNHCLFSFGVLRKKGFPRNFAKFTGKQLCQSFFFDKVFLIKKRVWHRYFPVNFAKFLRKPFPREHLQWLLLKILTIYCNATKVIILKQTYHWKLQFLFKYVWPLRGHQPLKY